ncbi:hypothetical protein JCM1840_001954 [Sporobolomyces johnsonii]
MSAAVDAPALFNSATLGVVLCSSPSLLSAAPPTTSLSCSSLNDPTLSQQTDDWLSRLLTSPQRPSAYYDERLKFHLIVTLPPSSPLTRSQAATFFLRSLDQPHLALSAALSYVPGTPRRATAPNPASSALAPSLSRSSISALAARVPLTPAPFPTHSNGDVVGGAGGEPASAGEGEAVPIASWTFDDAEGRVWVGKEPEGSWVGVWEFESDVAFLRTSFVEPKLALTINITFRDDPKLGTLIERARRDDVAGEGGEGGGSSADEVLEEEDYMDESYDDVNLLSALSPVSSIPLHLPFSRLRAAYLPPVAPPPLTTGHARRPSRSYSISSPLSAHDTSTPLHPSLRRSVLRTLPVRSALKLEMRTIPCPVGALGLGEGGRVWEGHEEGLVLCVEVAGPPASAGSGTVEAFEIERIEVNVTGGGSGSTGGPAAAAVGRAQGDVDVREITGERAPAAAAASERIRLTSSDQHNFLYALSVAPCALMPDEPLGPGAAPPEVGTVPIAVATSPSQRFTARFGAEDNTAAGALGAGEVGREQKEQKARDSAWRRNLEIVVRGRPVWIKREDRRSLTGGYSVPDSLAMGEEAEHGEDLESPTQPFASRWNCTLDISPFARRPPPRVATFHSPSSPSSAPAAPFRPTSISAPSVPLLRYTGPLRPKSTSSNPARLVEVESIAGSKRHTMASLASLSLKSPVLNRRGSTAPTRPPLDRQGSTRALPPTPLSPPLPLPTPGATGPPRRFFSLPSSDPSSPSSSSTALPPMPILQTDTPPPLHAPLPSSSGGTPKRTSRERESGAEPTRRASWMSGLGIGSSGTARGSTSSLGFSPGAPPQGGRTSWDRRDSAVSVASAATVTSSGLGIGMGLLEEEDAQPEAAAAAVAPELAATTAMAHQKGRVLITVSLVPLRTPKPRHRNVPFASALQSATLENLPPPTLPGLAPHSPDPSSSPASQPPPLSPHASFAFPASSSPSCNPATPTLPSSTDPDPEVRALAEQQQTHLVTATSRMPRVGLLDVFLVQLFVVNQTPDVKRFVVGVPPEYAVGGGGGGADDGSGRNRSTTAWPSSGSGKGGRSFRAERGGGGGTEARERRDKGERLAKLVPLENDVRIGPLAPNTCASVGIRFLAIRPGSHVVERLRLVDLSDGSETMLDRAVWVVVE